MVQLKDDLSIVTKWGKMYGRAGDWLANRNYSPTTGEPGTEYAIVTANSFSQNYKAIPQPLNI
jgi:hypothetical protein